jgi:hypothetical protein
MMTLDSQSGDPSCRMCPHSPSSPSPPETVLTVCRGTAKVRERMFPHLLNTLLLDTTLAQFIIDCSSFNLPADYRINMDNDGITEIFAVCRNICYMVNNYRVKQLKLLARHNS